MSNALVATDIAGPRGGIHAPARVALLGIGTVGCAVLARLSAWEGTRRGESLTLVHASNSRVAVSARQGLCPRAVRALANSRALRLPVPGLENVASSDAAEVALALEGAAVRIVIDATASDDVAARHATWLADGIHVVTANKLGQGTSLARWDSIQNARDRGRAHYGDGATVGAGLPLLRSIRELQAGGDRIHAIAGSLSGSLAWLLDQYDGERRFSSLLRAARDAGFTEPDPRDDLSGEDVRRKLLVLARVAGSAMQAADIGVESLVPAELAGLRCDQVDAALPAFDRSWDDRHRRAVVGDGQWRYVARLDGLRDGKGCGRVGLEVLPAGHPLAAGSGADNRVGIWSDRYERQPLIVQGPGAGAGVTAAALLDDVLRIVRLSDRGTPAPA